VLHHDAAGKILRELGKAPRTRAALADKLRLTPDTVSRYLFALRRSSAVKIVGAARLYGPGRPPPIFGIDNATIGGAMFHAGNDLYFGRKIDGQVRVLCWQFTGPPPAANQAVPKGREPKLDVTLPIGTWASIVAAVSGWGEDSESFRRALVFHNGVGKPSPEDLAARIAAAKQSPQAAALLMRASVLDQEKAGAEAGPEI
jgi:hypothetical protein